MLARRRVVIVAVDCGGRDLEKGREIMVAVVVGGDERNGNR